MVKKRFFMGILALTLIFGFTLSSCDDSSDGGSNNENNNGGVTVTIPEWAQGTWYLSDANGAFYGDKNYTITASEMKTSNLIYKVQQKTDKEVTLSGKHPNLTDTTITTKLTTTNDPNVLDIVQLGSNGTTIQGRGKLTRK
jgi:hypothetical protein